MVSRRKPSLSHRPLLALCTALLLAGPAAAHAQNAVIRGSVLTADAAMPVAGARLLLSGMDGRLRHQTNTDSAGAFRMEVGAGRYTLVILSDGFAAAESQVLDVESDSEHLLEIRLGAGVFELQPIEVGARVRITERVREFHERAAFNQSIGRGRIYTRADIERLNPQNAEFLLGTVPTGRCRPEIRLDGVPAHAADLRSITPANLEGMEIYIGTEVPRQFEERGVCGVALVWTRAQPDGMRRMGLGRVLIAGVFGAALFFIR